MDKSCNNAALVLADLVCKYCVAEIWLGVPQPLITHCIDLIIFVTCNIYPAAVNRKKEKKKMYTYWYVFPMYLFVILILFFFFFFLTVPTYMMFAMYYSFSAVGSSYWEISNRNLAWFRFWFWTMICTPICYWS